jgi:hypothetical protein
MEIEMEELYMKMLKEPLSYESCEIESMILFIEEIKDNYRMNNQLEFEKYDILQEEFYKILEDNFSIKYDNIPDKWNNPK